MISWTYFFVAFASPFVLFEGVTVVALSTHAVSKGVNNEPERRLAFKNLDPVEFRHPLDRDLTSIVKRAPFSRLAEQGIRSGLTAVEQGVRLDLLASSVKVGAKQLPELYDSLVDACEILGLPTVPELYVQSNAQANAYTLALQGRDTPPIVVVTSALLDRCTTAEVQAILGHELGHLKCEHSLYLTLGSIASTPLLNLPFLGRPTQSLLEDWRLSAEYSCDRAALLVAQDLEVVQGAMLALVSGIPASMETNTEAFVAQCVEYDNLLKSANPLVRASIQRQQRTHPLPVRRVVALEEWAESNQYKNILKVGTFLQGSDGER